MPASGAPGIPTMYRGVKFRSRLEARWQEYFDLIGLLAEWEPETFGVPECYMPDYRVSNGYAEVKHDFNNHDIGKCVRLARLTGQNVFLLEGPPDLRPFKYLRCSGIGKRPRVDYFMPVNWMGTGRFYYANTGTPDVLRGFQDAFASQQAAIARGDRFGAYE